MVLELIVSPKSVEKRPVLAFFFGIVLAFTGIVLGGMIFKNDASLAGILIITMAAVPFFLKIMDIEENVDERLHSVKKFFLRNEKLLKIYFFFYLGVALVYGFMHRMLPEGYVLQLFGKQISVFSAPYGAAGYFSGSGLFWQILSNNIYVIIIAIVLSLLYGVGSIMVLTWNASVLGIFFSTLGPGSAGYIPHTALEFLAYFSAAIAGSLISVALERDDYKSRHFKNITKDCTMLFAFSLFIVIIAAVVEVY